MEESFDLPVTFQGKELVCSGKLITMGYTYKIYISVNGQEIIFEPDEERKLRSVVESDSAALPRELIRIIGEELTRNLDQ